MLEPNEKVRGIGETASRAYFRHGQVIAQQFASDGHAVTDKVAYGRNPGVFFKKRDEIAFIDVRGAGKIAQRHRPRIVFGDIIGRGFDGGLLGHWSVWTKKAVELFEKIKAENRERYDYRQFLKKFAVLKEEQQIDSDAFDYGFYTYGLSLYGNMPLIEPLETKEVKKVEEFIIAIDTSMSCSGELVKRFLEETWSILRETDSLFHTVNIHIIQCDEAVRKDDKITSKEELEEYMKNLEIEGKGGTDFVPVLTYVQELLRRKEFSNLRGLLYFTDGKGRFPKKMPPYQTAFVLVQKEFEEIEVPPWAIRIYQTEEDGYGLGEKKDEH